MCIRDSYNPFAYIHSEKDLLKLVTTLIANTKGEGKAGDDFWVKAETLLYCALIGYIHYEAPVEEQNFSTLIEFINAMEVQMCIRDRIVSGFGAISAANIRSSPVSLDAPLTHHGRSYIRFLLNHTDGELTPPYICLLYTSRCV